MLALARAMDEPFLVAESAASLLKGREAILPLGTAHLASLYAAHGGALHRVVREGCVPDAEEAARVAESARQSMLAALRIRECCLGAAHPLTRATAAAVEAAAARRRSGGPRP